MHARVCARVRVFVCVYYAHVPANRGVWDADCYMHARVCVRVRVFVCVYYAHVPANRGFWDADCGRDALPPPVHTHTHTHGEGERVTDMGRSQGNIFGDRPKPRKKRGGKQKKNGRRETENGFRM